MRPDPKDDQLDRVFFALSDRTRRKMLAQLAKGETTVSALAKPHDMSLPAILKHLGILRGAGLIIEEKDGRVRRCKLDPDELRHVSEWISYYSHFWETQLDELEKYLEKIDEPKSRKNK